MVNCAMMHGLAILLPESILVQSPLRLSACAHMHIHAYLELECEQALTHGSRPPEAWAVTAGGHGISTSSGHIVERLPHGELVHTRMSTCGESSDDISTYLANSRMAVRLRLRSFVVPCPESPLQRSRRRSMPRVEIRCTRWMCPIGCGYARRVARARHSRVSIPNCPWKQSFEGSRTV